MNFIRPFLLFLSVFAFQGISAQEDDFRKKAPEPGPAPEIKMGDYQEFTLENGLKVVVVENHKLPKVSFQLLVDAPLRKEGEYTGTAALAGELLSRGTEKRDKAAIDAAVDFIGASFSTSSEGMFGSCLTQHRDSLLAIMSEVLLQPSFPEEEFDKLKKQRLSELSLNKDEAGAIAARVSQVLRFGEHPYGEITTEKTLEHITVERCREYYKNYFLPNNSYLAVVGDIGLDSARAVAKRYFGSWEKGESEKAFFERPEPPAQTEVAFVDKAGAVQSVIQLTYPVNLKPGTEDAIVANLLNTLLGGPSLNSRLNLNIREDKGYSYGANSTLQADKYIGYFSAGGNVRNEVTDSAVAEFLYEMKRLREDTVSYTELQSVKNYITGSFARALERPETVARFALNTIRYKLPEDYYANYLKRMQAITPGQLMEAAREYILPGKAHILVVGNKSEVADELARFAGSGEVLFYDADGQLVKGSEASVPEGLTPQGVVQDYIAAIGGEERLREVEDLTLEMSTTVQGMSLLVNLQRKAPNKMLNTVEMNGSPVNVTKFDGEQGLVVAMGQEQKLEEEDAREMKQQAMLFPELEYDSKGYTLTLEGIEQVEGSDAYRIQVVSPSGRKSTEFYDTESKLKLKTISTQKGPQGETTLTNLFADYRQVDGIMLPYELTSTGMAPFPITMKVEAVQVNSGLEDSIFEVE